MQSKQDRSRENAKHYLQNVIEEKEITRLEYSSLLASIIHVNHSHHNCCSLSKFHPPILSGILPLSDETIVRVSIGSHSEKKDNNDFVTRHNSTLVDVHIPPRIYFYSTMKVSYMLEVLEQCNVRECLQSLVQKQNMHHCKTKIIVETYLFVRESVLFATF